MRIGKASGIVVVFLLEFLAGFASPLFAGEENSLRSFLLRECTIPRYSCRIVAVYPHDSTAFTQGLVLVGEVLYESTGLYGESSLRKVDLKTGRVKKQVNLDSEYFAEGIAVWGENIIQLSWDSRVAFLYHKETLQQLAVLPYPYEGWGLTTDGESLITSDGSAVIRFLDPVYFTERHSIEVRVAGRPVNRLNELEYFEGQIYANVWYEDVILIIDPQSGEVLGWIDCAELSDPGKGGENVLNGIAVDPKDGSLLVTGKRWHQIYRIRLEEE